MGDDKGNDPRAGTKACWQGSKGIGQAPAPDHVPGTSSKREGLGAETRVGLIQGEQKCIQEQVRLHLICLKYCFSLADLVESNKVKHYTSVVQHLFSNRYS